MLRWLLWIIGGLVVLLIIALFAVPPLTGGMIASRIVDTIEQETGRTASVDDVSWQLLPSPSARITGLAIANTPDGVADDFVSLGTAEVDVALLPLIGGGVEIRNVIVQDLTVALEEAEDGTGNWEFAPQGEQAAEPPAEEGAGGSDRGGASGFDAVIDALNISGVTVTYQRLSEDQPALSLVDGGMTGGLTGDGTLDLDGSASVNGQPVDLTVHADNVQDLMAGQGSLAVDFQSPVATATIDGSQSGNGFTGTVDVQVPSLDAVADFLALPSEQRPPFEQFSLVADLAGSPDGFQVDNIQMSMDEATVTGTVSFVPGPPQRITAQLQAAGFDLAVLPTPGDGPIDRVGGLVNADIDIVAEGDDAAAMQQTLDGTIDVSVANGLVHVQRPDGSRTELEQLTASFSMAGRQAGTDLTVNGVLNGRDFSVDGSIGSVDAATTGAVPASFTMTSDAGTFAFDGQADAIGQAVSGTIDLDIPSLAGLMTWLDMATDDLPVDRVTASGTVAAQGQSVSLTDVSFALDDMTGTATLTAAGDPLPTLDGTIALGNINADAFTGSDASGGSGGGSAGGGSGGGSGGESASDGEARFDMLNNVSVDLSVTAESLTYSGVVTGPTSIDLTIQGGALDLSIAETPVNDGSIGASFAANAADSSIGIDLSVANIAARPFLSSFADIDWLSGTATMNASITGSGTTRSAILSSLAGTASFLFRDGSVDGINIAGLLRDPVQALTNPEMLETQSTDFAELSATTSISNGIATTNDLVMLAPIFRLTGEGSASLPTSSLDFLFVPTLVATLEGQGGQVQDGLAIPIRVTGPFDDPQYRLEINPTTIESFIENPQGAIDALRGLSGEGGSLPSLDQLLPGSNGEDGGGGSTQDLLEGLGRGLLGN